jgi:hypothetical protein
MRTDKGAHRRTARRQVGRCKRTDQEGKKD